MSKKSKYTALFISVIVAFAGLFILTTCTKEEQELKRIETLNGNWEVIPLAIKEDYNHTVWEFWQDTIGQFFVTVKVDGAQPVTEHYVLKLDNYKYYLTFDGLHPLIDGKYIVLKLTDNILAIERISWEFKGWPYKRIEFYKID